LQRVFYGGNAGLQQRTFQSYLYKQMVPSEPWGDLRLLWRTVASMVHCGVIGREVERLRRLDLQGH
jgi:geranylgeranyl reductase